MCDQSSGDWATEVIPDSDHLFYRVPIGWLKNPDKKMHPAVFRENKGSMSTDWDKYSSAKDTLDRINEERRSQFRVIKLKVAYIRNHGSLSVKHSPVKVPPLNRAHTDVLGVDTRDGVELEQDEREENKDYLFEMFDEWKWEDVVS